MYYNRERGRDSDICANVASNYDFFVLGCLVLHKVEAVILKFLKFETKESVFELMYCSFWILSKKFDLLSLNCAIKVIYY